MFRRREPRTHSYLGGDSGDHTSYVAPAKSCGICHGTGYEPNKAGRPTRKQCSCVKRRRR